MSETRREHWLKAAALGVALLGGAVCLEGWQERGADAVPEGVREGAKGENGASGGDWAEGAGEEVWGIFRAGASETAAEAGTWGETYRLAGVFRTLGDGEGEDGGEYFAILDERGAAGQHLLGRGEKLGEMWVKEVGAEHVVLTDGRREEALFLAAGGHGAGTGPTGGEGTPETVDGWAATTNRFGTRTGEWRWTVSRESVLEYYQELMDDPERAVALFDALEPDWGGEGEIEGYRVNPERGEADFFAEVGLEAGDVVRRVNSMHMTSQRRAEHFIREFVRGGLGAVVLDIERGGKAERLIYLVE